MSTHKQKRKLFTQLCDVTMLVVYTVNNVKLFILSAPLCSFASKYSYRLCRSNCRLYFLIFLFSLIPSHRRSSDTDNLSCTPFRALGTSHCSGERSERLQLKKIQLGAGKKRPTSFLFVQSDKSRLIPSVTARRDDVHGGETSVGCFWIPGAATRNNRHGGKFSGQDYGLNSFLVLFFPQKPPEKRQCGFYPAKRFLSDRALSLPCRNAGRCTKARVPRILS